MGSEMCIRDRVTLECFTGSRPFHGDAVETALARLEEAPEIPADLPEPWPRLVASMTALDPADRPTAEELVAELEAPGTAEAPATDDATVLQTVAVGIEAPTEPIDEAPVDVPVDPPAAPAADPTPPPAPGPTSGRPTRTRPWHGVLADPRHRRIALAVGAALVLALVLIVVVVTSGGDDPDPPRTELDREVPADVIQSLEQLRDVVAP